MKKMILWALLIALFVISGCANSSALIKASSTSIRSDVFQELDNASPPVPQGYADLRITSSLKTHKPGAYSKEDIHGTPAYRLLMNIDGQAVLLQGNLQSENSEPMKLVDPEAGDGIRYRFTKIMRLKAGTYRFVVALPDDGIAVERELTLKEGDVNNLVLEPIYATTPGKRRPGTYSSTGFMEGIRSIRLSLNGRGI